MTLQSKAAPSRRVAEVFEATELGAPFKVLLHNAVTIEEDPETNEVLRYSIPNLPQLLVVVMMSRLFAPYKLTGADIRFVRKVLGFKQKDLAAKVGGMSPEHLSRCENGGPPLSPAGDQLLRVFALRQALKLPDMPKNENRARLEDMIDRVFDGMQVSSARAVGNEIVFRFAYKAQDVSKDSASDPSTDWVENQAA